MSNASNQKRILWFILFVILVLGTILFGYPTAVKALSGNDDLHSYTFGGFALTEIDGQYCDEQGNIYSLDNQTMTAELVRGANQHTVFIPGTVLYADIEYNVVSIGEGAFSYSDKLVCVSIEEGIKRIKKNAFASLKNLTDIALPFTLLSIEDNAFNNCTGLVNVTIPDAVTSIGDGCFQYCISLSNIKLPAFLISIGNDAFSYCEQLNRVIIPEGTVSIGKNAFASCGLFGSMLSVSVPKTVQFMDASAFNVNWTLDIDISLENPYFHEIDGIVYDTDKTHIVLVLEPHDDPLLPDTLVTIDSGCFRNQNCLTRITIPDSVKSIGDDAFAGCGKLEVVYLSQTLEEIGNGAFFSCGSLRVIDLPESLKKIGYSSFSNCSSLKKIVIPKNVNQLSKFWNAGNTEIEISELNTSFKIIDGVLCQISDAQCHQCWVTPQAQSVVIQDDRWMTGTLNTDMIQYSNVESVTLSDSITYIASSAFFGCRNMRNIHLPNQLTQIGYSAFDSCFSLTSIELPATLKTIDSQAFLFTKILYIKNNTSLPLVPGSDAYGHIAENAIVIEDENGHFYFREDENSYFLTDDGFLGMNSKVDENECILLGYVGDEDTITLPLTINGKKCRLEGFLGGKRIIIPEGYKEIPEKAFEWNRTVKSIELPESLEMISDRAFTDCQLLENINIPDSVTSIGSYAFCDCYRLKEIALPDSIVSLGISIFANCWDLDCAKLPLGLKEIPQGMFSACGLTSVHLPDGVEIIGNGAFNSCSSLDYIYFPRDLKTIGTSALAYCSKSLRIDISEENVFFSIVDGILYNAEKTKLIMAVSPSEIITIPETISVIPANAFAHQSSIKRVILFEGITGIEADAFMCCDNLEYINIPDSVNFIGYQAFYQCKKLKEITLRANIEYEKDPNFGVNYTFSGTGIGTLIVESGVTEIPLGMFSDCRELKSVVLSDTVRTIGPLAFANCIHLEKVELGSGLQKIEEKSFQYCFRLTTVINHSSLSLIPGKMWNGKIALYVEEIINDNGITSLRDQPRYSASFVEELLLSGVKGNDCLSDVEKVLLVHDRLISWVEYGYQEFFHSQGGHPRYLDTLYGAYVMQWIVCEGYSNVFMDLLDCLGIDCIKVVSYDLDHAWNLVVLDGQQYYVDCTWDDPIVDGKSDMLGYVGHTNFLRSLAGMEETGHTASDYIKPETSTQYDDALWQKSHTAFCLFNNKIYFINDETGYICEWNNGNPVEIYEIEGHSNYLSKLSASCECLYFTNGKSVYSYIPGEEPTVLFQSDPDETIIGFKYESGAFHLEINTVLDEGYRIIQCPIKDASYHHFENHDCEEKKRCSHCGMVLAEESSHIFDEPTWIWSEDYMTVQAVFKCSECGKKNQIIVDSQKTETVEAITFKAELNFYGKDYSTEVVIPIEYTIRFEDYDGTIISESTYHYGDTVIVPANPSRDADTTYTYAFAGWDSEVAVVTGNATYKATYTATFIEYTVKFVDWDNSVISTKTYHYGDTVTAPANPSRAADVFYTYAFAGWDKAITLCYGDATYKATYTATWINYTVTFKNYDGSVISTNTYHYGDTVTIPANPSRAADETYTYAFTGWDKPVTAVQGNETYTAQFKSTYIDYTVKFVNYDGSVISEKTYHYGDTVTVPSDPTRSPDETYTYTFKGWDKEITTVKGSETYTATYDSAYIEYTVRFVDYDDSLISEGKYHYGDTVIAPPNPTRESDNEYSYTFNGWDQEITLCYGNKTYRATYTTEQNVYTITFKNDDGSVIAVQTYHYGDTVTPPSDPVKNADETYTYAFSGWTPAITTVIGNTVYTATYQATYINYTVRFLNDDGTVLSEKTYHYGETVQVPETPVKNADNTYTYVFDGWDKDITVVKGNVDYTATYRAVYIEYTIRFQNDDGTVLSEKTYHYGDTVEEPAAPTKAANKTYTYAFKGWDKPVGKVSGNTTYTATYTRTYIDYTVKFVNYDGSVISEKTYHYGDTVEVPADPTRSADNTYTYAFAGWDKTVSAVTENTVYTATYTATYIEYTVRFVDYDDRVISEGKYHYGDTITVPENPTRAKDGQYTYTFAGWDQEITPCYGNKTYRATYTTDENVYTITFKNDDGTVIAVQTYHYNDTVTPPSNPVKAADKTYTYTFAGWTPALEKVTKDAVYTATYTPVYIDYTVKFVDYDGTVISEKTYHYGDAVTIPANPSRAADETYTYAFTGWDKPVTAVQGNETYTAQYQATYIDYTVKFVNYDGSVISEKIYHFGETVTVPEDPSKPADMTYTYTFTGWDKPVTAVQGNETYTAQFKSTYIDYTVKFVNYDGSVISEKTYHYGDTVTVPSDPTRSPDETYTYTFKGWDKEITTVKGSETYTATYDSAYIEYTVRFVDYDDSLISEGKYHYGDTVIAPPNPTRESDNEYTYTFNGWDQEITLCYGNKTYRATYTTDENVFTITFKNYDGGIISVKTYHYGDTVTVPSDPARNADETYAYVFAGWAPEVTTVTGDATYTATYTPVYIEYTVKFVNWDDTVISENTYHYGDTVTVPANPTRPSDEANTYAFAGWEPAVTVVSGNAVYKATFVSAQNEYTVRFLNYDGSLISEKKYHYGDTVTVPANPSREADETYTYTFNGWNKAVTIVTSDADYTAEYRSVYINYTVRFVDWDGRAISEKTYHYGDAVTVPENPTRQADETNTYTFSGWDREITTVKGDVTYTATYTKEANVYTVTFKNDDGTTILIATYHYGDEVVLPSNPVKAEDESYTYTFTGWTPSVTLVFGDATYTAIYRADPKTPDTVEVKLDTANGGQNGETTILIPSEGKDTLSEITSTTAAPDYIPGDVNGDGDIDGRDYIVVKKFVLGTVDFTERQQQIADINGDGEVDGIDYLLIKKHVLGTYTIPGPQPVEVPGPDYADFAVIVVNANGKVQSVKQADGKSKADLSVPTGGYAIAIPKSVLDANEPLKNAIAALKVNDSVTLIGISPDAAPGTETVLEGASISFGNP